MERGACYQPILIELVNNYTIPIEFCVTVMPTSCVPFVLSSRLQETSPRSLRVVRLFPAFELIHRLHRVKAVMKTNYTFHSHSVTNFASFSIYSPVVCEQHLRQTYRVQVAVTKKKMMPSLTLMISRLHHFQTPPNTRESLDKGVVEREMSIDFSSLKLVVLSFPLVVAINHHPRFQNERQVIFHKRFAALGVSGVHLHPHF
jgi:hypothetical protein